MGFILFIPFIPVTKGSKIDLSPFPFYRTSGHLWQGRYKSFAIENDDHLLTVARYVEGNPVRAGLVVSMGT